MRDALGEQASAYSSPITCSAGGRSSRGLRRMKRIPELLPPRPANDMNWSTAGFYLTIAATSCWWRIIA